MGGGIKSKGGPWRATTAQERQKRGASPLQRNNSQEKIEFLCFDLTESSWPFAGGYGGFCGKIAKIG